MGTREQAAEKDFSGIPLEEEVEESLKESAVISMGTEISEMDLENIVALCDQVIRMLLHPAACHPSLAHMAKTLPSVNHQVPIPAKAWLKVPLMRLHHLSCPEASQ